MSALNALNPTLRSQRFVSASLMLCLMLTAGVAGAIQPQRAPGLLSTELARTLLENHPAVRAARAGLDVGKFDAQALNASPYDWNLRASGQRREVSELSYSEWNTGVERTIRLPSKASADRELGQSEVALSEAAYGEALHEAARELSGLWVDWLAAEQAQATNSANLKSFAESVAAVEKRKRAGDASQLDLGTARAELVEQRRLENDAKTAANVAWVRLSTKFPGLARQPAPLPMPLPIEADTTAWRARILDQSDEIKLAVLSVRKAAAQAQRARANRIPDPTVGVYSASEVGGRERILGVTVTIPFALPGSARYSHSAAATASAEVSRLDIEAKLREYDAELASEFINAKGAFDSLQIAGDGAAAMQENAALIQRAYTLGESGLQDLLIARRQAASASQNALQAQTMALKAYYRLVIDAHWVWDLDHE